MKMSEAEKERGQKGPQQTSPFEGEHENLESGDAAVWREGLELTISDVHLAPNQRKIEALQRWERDKLQEEKMRARGRTTGKDPN